MIIGTQVPIGVRIGYAKAPDAKLVLMSLSNAATTITCSGATVPDVTWNAASDIGYFAHVTLTGLSEFTSYSYTVTQGANSVSGSFRTLPGTSDDFSFYLVTCDPNYDPNGDSLELPSGHGFYKRIREQVAAGSYPPCVGILHTGDFGYNSARTTYVDGVALAAPNAASWALRNYVAAWFSYNGLFPDLSDQPPAIAGAATDIEKGKINNGLGTNPDKVWCSQNIPIWPQWGDWEFSNDLGWDVITNSGTANGYHATYTAGAGTGQSDGGGRVAWGYFMEYLQPPTAQSADTAANHWAFTCGPVRIIAPDFITNGDKGTADAVNYAAGFETIFTSYAGANQVTDLLSAANTDEPFKVFAMESSHRYVSATRSEYSSGVQHPWYNHQPTEYGAMFYGAGSIGANTKTNGTLGATIFLHGDYHSPYVYRHENTVGGVTALFYDIGAATVGGSPNFEAYVIAGETLDGTEVIYSRADPVTYLENCSVDLTSIGGPAPYRHYFGIRVDVYGSRSRPELRITLMDWQGSTLWEGKWLARSSNEALSTSYEVPSMVGTSRKAMKA